MNGQIIHGDALKELAKLPDESVDLICTDPPYGLEFMGKDWDKAVPCTETWKECIRLLKPGAFAFIMSSPRLDVLSQMVIRLNEAGFKTDFTPIYWTYASGFPKAMNISKAVDKRLGAEREVIGINPNSRPNCEGIEYVAGGTKNCKEVPLYGKAVTTEAKSLDGSYGGFQPKPAVEVIIVAMKPLSEKTYVDQAMKNKKGITWLDDCRVPYENQYKPQPRGNLNTTSEGKYGYKDCVDIGSEDGRFPANLLVSDDVLNDGQKQTQGHWAKSKVTGYGDFGGGTAEYHGVGEKGTVSSFSRYFSLDAWYEKNIKKLPKEVRKTYPFLIVPKADKGEKNEGCDGLEEQYMDESREVGSPGGTNPRNRGAENPRKNFHPTVKPLQLMSYLVTLGSRPGDTVLDPFLGSGTTGLACEELNRKWIGIELNEEYVKIANARLSEWKAQTHLFNDFRGENNDRKEEDSGFHSKAGNV